MSNEIEQPNHYTWRGGERPMAFNLRHHVPWGVGAVLKYLYRFPKKGGLKDLRKAERILRTMLEGTTEAKPFSGHPEVIDRFLKDNNFSGELASTIRWLWGGQYSRAQREVRHIIDVWEQLLNEQDQQRRTPMESVLSRKEKK